MVSKHGGICQGCGNKRVLMMIDVPSHLDSLYLCSFCLKQVTRISYARHIDYAGALELLKEGLTLSDEEARNG